MPDIRNSKPGPTVVSVPLLPAVKLVGSWKTPAQEEKCGAPQGFELEEEWLSAPAKV